MWKTPRFWKRSTSMAGFPHLFLSFQWFSMFPCYWSPNAITIPKSPWAMGHGSTLSALSPLCPGRSLWMSVRKALDFTTFTCRETPRHATPRRASHHGVSGGVPGGQGGPMDPMPSEIPSVHPKPSHHVGINMGVLWKTVSNKVGTSWWHVI